VAAGTPLGSVAFVEVDARSKAETVAGLVTALASLPQGRQDKFLLLRSSLHARLTHLTRITPWSRLSPHVASAERRVLLAILDLEEHPLPADMQSDPVVAQLALPLRAGRFGLRLTTPLEASAAFLAAAGAADVAVRPAPPPFHPFNPTSPHCNALIALWVALHDAAPGLWSPELWELAAPLLAPVLLHAQPEYGRHLADQRFADLLTSAPPSFEGTRFRARLHSRACRPASIWLDTMHISIPLTLSDSDFVSSARLRLGLPAGPANAPALRCDCETNALPGDSNHPLTGTCLALQRALRHDFVTTSWRHSAACAGVHTTAEPPFRFFPAPSSPSAFPPAGSALASSSGGCASGLPVLVPDAPALAPAAASALPADPAPSPGPGDPSHSSDPLGVPPPLGPGALGDVMFVFPRRLVVGDVPVIHPAAASFAVGAAHTPGFAAAAQDASKRRAYQQVSSALPFVPMSGESFGRLGAPALTLLGDLADQAVQAGGLGLSRTAFTSGALRELSVALCRGNASLCRLGEYIATRAAGRTPMRGLARPLAEVV
jgi:hypothetical protein